VHFVYQFSAATGTGKSVPVCFGGRSISSCRILWVFTTLYLRTMSDKLAFDMRLVMLLKMPDDASVVR
jgi:hypothetical protein